MTPEQLQITEHSIESKLLEYCYMVGLEPIGLRLVLQQDSNVKYPNAANFTYYNVIIRLAHDTEFRMTDSIHNFLNYNKYNSINIYKVTDHKYTAAQPAGCLKNIHTAYFGSVPFFRT